MIHRAEAWVGQTMKLMNNTRTATRLAVTCEGLVLGAKSGLEPMIMLKVLNASTAGEV